MLEDYLPERPAPPPATIVGARGASFMADEWLVSSCYGTVFLRLQNQTSKSAALGEFTPDEAIKMGNAIVRAGERAAARAKAAGEPETRAWPAPLPLTGPTARS